MAKVNGKHKKVTENGQNECVSITLILTTSGKYISMEHEKEE